MGANSSALPVFRSPLHKKRAAVAAAEVASGKQIVGHPDVSRIDLVVITLESPTKRSEVVGFGAPNGSTGLTNFPVIHSSCADVADGSFIATLPVESAEG